MVANPHPGLSANFFKGVILDTDLQGLKLYLMTIVVIMQVNALLEETE